MALSHEVYVALGANVGDASRNLMGAIVEFSVPGSGIESIHVSGFHTTEPVGGPPGQKPYVNAVVRFSTHFEPQTLLSRLKELERQAGRNAGPTWGSRPLDLDILTYGRLRLNTSNLIVPHPRMTVRRFVLEPLEDVAPAGWVHPQLGWSVEAILEHLDRSEPVVALGDLFDSFERFRESSKSLAPWRFVRDSADAMFDVRPISQFDPGESWIRPRFYPASEDPVSAIDQVLATCDSLRSTHHASSN
ncbi:2-amino-4-hydroxy-6-hydroxymethyldihydropteridine diphosphokinase [bacterium]|nr:2-amino-4-hydroxy-6-hydroxymethyldihydropteridine diphosphokinase [bacterium]